MNLLGILFITIEVPISFIELIEFIELLIELQ